MVNRTRYKSPYYISPAREERALKKLSPVLKVHILIDGEVKCNTPSRPHNGLKTTEIESEVECHHCKRILAYIAKRKGY